MDDFLSSTFTHHLEMSPQRTGWRRSQYVLLPLSDHPVEYIDECQSIYGGYSQSKYGVLDD